ncbi:hypothetical protein Ctha_0421 [Chloroherpeton thalassium ATCC 35110]|uniref:Uncharacterized protein n=1 Tax=Chloroherpeton thalassium (strain ATCC 35110 / GB-78) TaxID=517418 RepID=B3QUI6_CHLT3|nr:hypothetical protein [Chloroherpeton thalassium]ACF12892.1 hypothetical protein Ctha_0421 [Chloroherpeton thalassium ATCC 35110]
MARFTVAISFVFFWTFSVALPAFAGLPRIHPASQVLPYPEGEGYTGFQAAFFSTTTEFAATGDKRDLFSSESTSGGKFYETTISVQYERGISNFWTLVVWLGYRNFSTKYTDLDVRPTDPARFRSIKTDAFSELWVSGRIKLWQQQTIVGAFSSGLQPGIKLPTGDVTTTIPTGTGAMDYELLLLPRLDVSAWGSPAALTGLVGYRMRGGGLDDELPYLLEFRVGVSKELVLRTSVGGISASPDGTNNVVGLSYSDVDYSTGDVDASVSVIGDEAYTQLALGFEFSFSRVVSVSFDYINRVSGKAAMSGETYLLGFALH